MIAPSGSPGGPSWRKSTLDTVAWWYRDVLAAHLGAESWWYTRSGR